MASVELIAQQLGERGEITLPDLIAAQDRLDEEAREVLPYSFDSCTHSKGYLRQSVWSCLDCGEKGVCYGCSISCHSDHRLVELWTKRRFQCDCPTSAMTSTGKRRCSLNPPHSQPHPPNEENVYSQNFSGRFCRCGRDYDAETETEAMVVCIGCEDWFHESCLNLQPRAPERDEPADEEEDEKDSLIPSDSYDGLICAQCAKHPFIEERKGAEGWMVIVPDGKGWTVLGRSGPRKRPSQSDEGSAAKRARLDTESTAITTPGATASSAPDTPAPEVKPDVNGDQPAVKAEAPAAEERKAAGDVFLAHGVRDKLKAELDATTAESLPFPLEDEEVYEPPADEDPPESAESAAERMIGTLPRVQAIEAVHGYNAMKDKLLAMLQGHAASGESVSKEDIEAVFEDLRRGKR